MPHAANSDAKTDSADANKKPNLRPIRAIIIDAGAVAQAVPIIMKAMGKVARFGDGAIWEPTKPPTNTNTGAAVWPKHCAASKTNNVR